MIVKCKKLFHHMYGYVNGPIDRQITKNKLYFVVGIELNQRECLIRVINDEYNTTYEKYPCELRELKDFEIIHAGIPEFWTYNLNESTMYKKLGPPDWMYYDEEREMDFLDDYWNGDPKAIEVYNRDIERMLNMHRKNYDVDRILEGFIAENDEDLEKIKIKKED